MTGKIYSDSANIYQDQARILFDYYKQAAEKIVSEEEKFEREIAKLAEEKVVQEKELSQAKLWKWVLCILIIPFIYFLIKENGIVKKIKALDDKILEFQKLHKEIFRDYQVTKLGVGYVPVAAQIPFEEKSFMIDYTGTEPNQEFKLHTLRQGELFTSTVSEMETLINNAPIVEKSDDAESVDTDNYSRSIQNVTYHDYFGKLDRSLRTSSFCLDDLDLSSVSLPAILPDSDFASYINEHSATDTGDAPIFEPFDTNKFQDDIEKFHSLNEMKKSLEKHSVQFEEVLKGLMMNMASSVQAITQLKVASTNKMVEQSNKILFRILKSSYNHYSPFLEAEEIERIRNEQFNYQDSVENYQPFQLKPSSKVKYDILSDSWVAEDGSKTNFPFGIHQIHEEIVAPIVQSLLQETRLERLKIYNNIKDQKINYLNQWHQDTEDFYARNRAESNDLINIMRSTLSEYISAYNAVSALEKTEQNMEQNDSLESGVVKNESKGAEVLIAFNAKSQEFQKIQNDFSDYMDRLKEDIDLKAEKFEHIEYYDASLRDRNFKNYAVASGRSHDIDERRKPLIAVNPFFAESSELPPVPSVEDITYEHMSMNLPNIARASLNEINNQEKLDHPNEDIKLETVNTADDFSDTSTNIDQAENKQAEVDAFDDFDDKKVDSTEESKDDVKIEEVKKCPSCGSGISDIDTFCPDCGFNLSNEETDDEKKDDDDDI